MKDLEVEILVTLPIIIRLLTKIIGEVYRGEWKAKKNKFNLW
jgi:hypothetical protein